MIKLKKMSAKLFDVSVTTNKRDLNDLLNKKLINNKKVKKYQLLCDGFFID